MFGTWIPIRHKLPKGCSGYLPLLAPREVWRLMESRRRWQEEHEPGLRAMAASFTASGEMGSYGNIRFIETKERPENV